MICICGGFVNLVNLIVNDYCNQHCEYCFASSIFCHGSGHDMDRTTAHDILSFAGRALDPKFGRHVGIAGGEPSLSPHFDDILQEISVFLDSDIRRNATLYTNGTCMFQYLDVIPKRLYVLVNVNHPASVGSANWDGTVSFLDAVYTRGDVKCMMGCNIHPGCSDYGFIWDLLDRYGQHRLRTSVVSPGGCFVDMAGNRDRYYESMKNIYLDFCRNALDRGITLCMDCGRIPLCYFSEDEADLVLKACDTDEKEYTLAFCEPHMDINYDRKVSICLIYAHMQQYVSMDDFDRPDELYRYLYCKYTAPLYERTSYGRCASCRKHDLMLCQGGCLGFIKK